jgi:hypothetical protein
VNITNDSDWLELGDGELGTVIGKVFSCGPRHITVTFSDWSQLYIPIEDGPLMSPPFDKGQCIKLHIERTEDGVMTTQEMIENAEIY